MVTNTGPILIHVHVYTGHLELAKFFVDYGACVTKRDTSSGVSTSSYYDSLYIHVLIFVHV